MFAGFEHAALPVGEGVTIDLLHAGSGPPLLLLHGFPQTRAAWHLVAPRLAQRFTVVVPDLPGYGRSRGPVPSADGASHSKRAMARALVAAMAALGHKRFAVAGHDRGARVAYRLALDLPETVAGLALLDIMTTLDTWEAMDWQAALSAYHWPFLAQDAAFVTAMIGADPGAYLDHLVRRWIGAGNRLDEAAYADYLDAIAQASVQAAMAADYRAGAGVDADHDREDRLAGRRIAVPVMLLRGAQYERRALTPAWAAWGSVAGEHVLDCGHFLAEEAPDRVADALAAHFDAL